MAWADQDPYDAEDYIKDVLEGKNGNGDGVEVTGEFHEFNGSYAVSTEGDLNYKVLDQEGFEDLPVVETGGLGSLREAYRRFAPWEEHPVLTEGGEAELYLVTPEIAVPLRKEGEHGYTMAYALLSNGEATETIGIRHAAGRDLGGRNYPAQDLRGDTGIENVNEAAFIKLLDPDEEGNYQSVGIANSEDAIARTLQEPEISASHIPESIHMA